MCSENGKWSIDGYINYDNGNCSICREERQYALYLSNVLRYYGKHHDKLEINSVAIEIFNSIFRKKGEEKEQALDDTYKNIYIENVFYEATFMRDFFERNRRLRFTKDQTKLKDAILKKKFKLPADKKLDKEKSFNHSLLKYCWDVICDRDSNPDKDINLNDVEEVNYGKNNIITDDGTILAAHSLARAMMNAKPDLAVIYYNKNSKSKKKLLFIECKFKSDEDCYYYKDNNDNNQRIYQTEVQGLIAEFLCRENSYLPDLEISKLMNNKDFEKPEAKYNKSKYISKKVTFVQEVANIEEINIANLIELEKSIFESK